VDNRPTHRVIYNSGGKFANAVADVYGLEAALDVAKHYRSQPGSVYARIRIEDEPDRPQSSDIIAAWKWSVDLGKWVAVNGQAIPGIDDTSPRPPTRRVRKNS
jgi:hypothetical protein